MESEFKVRRSFSRYFVIAFDKCDIVYNAIVNKISKVCVASVRRYGRIYWNIFGNRVSRAIKKLSTIKSIRILEKPSGRTLYLPRWIVGWKRVHRN